MGSWLGNCRGTGLLAPHYDPAVLPSLSGLFAVLGPIGGLVGAIIGFAVRAPADRDLVKNVIDGAQIGAICGTIVAIAIWVGGKAAGA
jgi:hypothetical protein